MNIYDRQEIFDYFIDPEWEFGEELATNAIAYRRLIESGKLDAMKGTHVLIFHGRIVKYYNEDISSEEYEELGKEYPGKYFAPITEKTVLLRRFSSNNDTTEMQPQVCYNLYTIGVIDRYCLMPYGYVL